MATACFPCSQESSSWQIPKELAVCYALSLLSYLDDHQALQHYGVRTERYKLSFFHRLNQWELGISGNYTIMPGGDVTRFERMAILNSCEGTWRSVQSSTLH